MEFHLYKWVSFPSPLPLCCLPSSPPSSPHVCLWQTMVPSLLCSLQGWVMEGGCHLGVFPQQSVMWSCPGQRKDRALVPGATQAGGGGRCHAWLESKEGVGMLVMSSWWLLILGMGSDRETSTSLSVKVTWVYFCRVVETQNLFSIDIYFYYYIGIKPVIYLGIL